MIKLLLTLFLFITIGCVKEHPRVEDSTPLVTQEGTDTGGGGFADQSAIDALNLAKHALAQRIENLPSTAFSPYKEENGYQFGLPERKRKAWLLKLIRGVKVRRVFEERYNKPLKFNYDTTTQEVYATNYFVQNFSYGRFQNSLPVDKVRLLHEIFLDILHEISHFYEVGQSKETDYQSDQWALDFLTYGLDAFYKCQNEDDYVFMINKSTGLTFVRHDPLDPGTTLIIQKTPELSYTREVDSSDSSFSLKVFHLPTNSHWKTNTGLVTYNNYDMLTEDYAMDIYQQYVVLASMKGGEDIPRHMHPIRREFIMNPHDHHQNFIFKFLDRPSITYNGSIFGYPAFKESEKKYVLFKKSHLMKDYFELDLETLQATYNVGRRDSPDEDFVFPPETEMKMECQNFHKQIIISTPTAVNQPDDYWGSFTED